MSEADGDERVNRYLRDIPLPGISEGEVGYRGPHVAGLVGITYRQLDYWTKTGLVRPDVRDAQGSGSQRLYSFDNIVELKAIKRLIDSGVSLQRIRGALEHLRRLGLSLRSVTLVSDGSTVYAVDDQRQIIDLLRKGQAVFAIALEPIYAETEAEIADLPSERAHPPVTRAGGEPPGEAGEADAAG